MNRIGLIILALVTIVALIVVLSLGGGDAQDARGGERLLPDLHAEVNDIDQIRLLGAGDEVIVTLTRSRERWRVAEKHDYEADFARVRDLLVDLAEARPVEPKTRRPDWYARLGVEDVEDASAAGVRVEFPGRELPALIVGEAAPTGGRYVRVAGDEQSWEVDRDITLARSALEWLERSVMDIPREDIESVVIRHPDGEVVQVRSTGPDSGEFVLLNVPEGREAAERWTIAQAAGALTGVRMEDVRPHAADEIPEDAVRVLYTTHDQLEFVTTVFSDDEGHWVHFQVTADTPVLGEGEHLTVEDNETVIDAVAVDARLSPWQFRVSESKASLMKRRLDDLLKPLEDAAGS